MRPRHVIMAVGVSGIPNIPDLKGADDFEGIILHSSGQSDDIDVNGCVSIGYAVNDQLIGQTDTGRSKSRIDRESSTIAYGDRLVAVNSYPISIEYPSRWMGEQKPVAECRRR